MATKTTNAPAKKAPASAPADAVKLLTQDHKDVHALFQQYKKLVTAEAASRERQAIADEICIALTVHATIEEEIFYPAARAAGVDSHLLDEATVEHASAKDLVAQIRAIDPEDDLYDAKVTVLGEYIDHHVHEEQDELFPACRKAGMDLKALGAELAERKEALLAEAAEEAA